jgi:hypothetical protein
MTTDEGYAKAMRHALEYVYVVAARRGLDTGLLVVSATLVAIPEVTGNTA